MNVESFRSAECLVPLRAAVKDESSLERPADAGKPPSPLQIPALSVGVFLSHLPVSGCPYQLTNKNITDEDIYHSKTELHL